MRLAPPPVDLVNRMFSIPQDIHPERMYVVGLLPGYGTIYDMGCGRNKTVPRAIGVDVLPVADITCRIEDLPKLRIESESSSAIISRHSIEHLEDPKAALEEWRRLLKPGGKIIVVLPDDEFIDTMDPIFGVGEHKHAFTRTGFRDLVESIRGLKVVKLETVVENWSFGGILKKIELFME